YYGTFFGLDQGWAMFTPELARRSPFLAARIEFTDDTSVLLLSENEPTDLNHYFRIGGVGPPEPAGTPTSLTPREKLPLAREAALDRRASALGSVRPLEHSPLARAIAAGRPDRGARRPARSAHHVPEAAKGSQPVRSALHHRHRRLRPEWTLPLQTGGRMSIQTGQRLLRPDGLEEGADAEPSGLWRRFVRVVLAFWCALIAAAPVALFRILIGVVLLTSTLSSLWPYLERYAGADGLCAPKALDEWLNRTGRFTMLRGPVSIPWL